MSVLSRMMRGLTSATAMLLITSLTWALVVVVVTLLHLDPLVLP